MPALLFLLPGCRVRADLPAGYSIWAPFRLQFYCNGHNWLALDVWTAEAHQRYTMADNGFIRIDDWVRAQEPGRTGFRRDRLHRTLIKAYAQQCCPGVRGIRTVLPLEPDAGGIRHRSCEPLHRHFLGRSTSNSSDSRGAERQSGAGRQLPRPADHAAADPGDRFSVLHPHRGQLHCKHRFGKCSIKMHDKTGIVLRIETTTNDVSPFSNTTEKVEQQPGLRRPVPWHPSRSPSTA